MIILEINRIIFISGTPGVGKTTVANKLYNDLNESYNVKLIKINDLAIENNLVIGKNHQKDYKIIDIENLDLLLQKTIDEFFKIDKLSKIILVEGHLSHLCSNPNKVIILRTNPYILKERLANRDYNSSKVKENLEAESLAVCTVEAFELHGDKVNEIDTSKHSIDNVVSLIKEVISNKKEFPVGNIDFMEWILDNP